MTYMPLCPKCGHAPALTPNLSQCTTYKAKCGRCGEAYEKYVRTDLTPPPKP